MKKLILLLLTTSFMQFSFAIDDSSFIFTKKTSDKTQVTVYFSLENDISLETILSDLKSVKGVSNASISEYNYIKIVMTDQSHNNEIRNVILKNGSDIDKKFIIIKSKSYYEVN